MRKPIGVLAAVIVFFGVLWAEKQEKEKPLRFEPAQVVSAVEAKYPVTSIATGTVIFEVAVGKSGEIEGVKVVHDIPSLTEEAEHTVRKWKFRPAKLDGKPVATPIVVCFTFNAPVIGW